MYWRKIQNIFVKSGEILLEKKNTKSGKPVRNGLMGNEKWPN